MFKYGVTSAVPNLNRWCFILKFGRRRILRVSSLTSWAQSLNKDISQCHITSLLLCEGETARNEFGALELSPSELSPTASDKLLSRVPFTGEEKEAVHWSGLYHMQRQVSSSRKKFSSSGSDAC